VGRSARSRPTVDGGSHDWSMGRSPLHAHPDADADRRRRVEGSGWSAWCGGGTTASPPSSTACSWRWSRPRCRRPRRPSARRRAGSTARSARCWRSPPPAAAARGRAAASATGPANGSGPGNGNGNGPGNGNGNGVGWGGGNAGNTNGSGGTQVSNGNGTANNPNSGQAGGVNWSTRHACTRAERVTVAPAPAAPYGRLGTPRRVSGSGATRRGATSGSGPSGSATPCCRWPRACARSR
jgi:hypothetical protein